VIQQIYGFGSQRQKADLAALAAHTDLRLGQQQVVPIERQYFLGAQAREQHQTHNGEIAGSAEAGPEPRDFVH
jgi:hypothetical protein